MGVYMSEGVWVGEGRGVIVGMVIGMERKMKWRQ